VAIWSASSSVRLLPYLKKVVAVSAATGLLISMALVGLADRVVSFLFGAAYQGAGQLLGVVAFAIPFRFIATAAGATLNSHADTRLRLMTQLAVLAAFLAGAWLALRLVAFESVLAVGGVYVICELVLSSLYLRAAWARATAHSQTAMAS
jgi:O-antigen/teichoic acid export membrane protein